MKSQQIETMLEKYSMDNFKVSRSEFRCPFCKSEVNPDTDFKDDLSKQEFFISRLCQKCQDSIFDY